jgi:hypothetical protein
MWCWSNLRRTAFVGAPQFKLKVKERILRWWVNTLQ